MDIRKAIYTPFPQAVPTAYAIDWEKCIKCDLCVEACKEEGPDCINLDDKDEIIEEEFGSIIVATGYKLFDPSVIERYSYGEHDDIHTSLEVERMLDPTGPTNGEVILSDGSKPKSVAIIHCAGSRDENYNVYCSRVCCMYSLKQAHLIKESIPDAEVFEIYMDMRSFGKGFEEFYNRMMEEDIIFTRGRAGAIDVSEEEGKILVSCEDSLLGERIEIPVDMTVLSPAIEPTSDTGELTTMLSISRSEDGFFMEKHPKLAPVNTTVGGIFLAGVCQGPKDIPDSVAQGSAAAEEAISMIDADRIELVSN